MDENLEWLTQNTEDLKSNKGNLTPPLPPTHTHQPLPHFSGFSPLSSKTFRTSAPIESNFGRSYPRPSLIRGDSKYDSSTLHLEVWTKYFRHRYSIKLSRT